MGGKAAVGGGISTMRFWWVNHKQTYKQEVGD